MKQSLAPILYVDKKLIISIGEIDKNKVPQIKWKSKARASPEGNPSKNKEVRLIVQERQIENGWTHVTLIAYKSKSEPGYIVPSKSALIGNIIYLSDVYAPLKDMMKIIITEKSIKDSASSHELTNSLKSRWNFELVSNCKEFNKFGDQSARISINRLQNSWIPML